MTITTETGVVVERVLLDDEPFVDWNAQWQGRGAWPVQWLSHPEVHADDVVVMMFRNNVTFASDTTVRLHISADERYELFVDGQRVGRGSEAGSPEKWFYETYDITFTKGTHTIGALVWHLGISGPSPCSQMSIRPGFLCAAQGDAHNLLSGGKGAWEVSIILGYSFSWPYPKELPFTGARVRINAADMNWDALAGKGEGWVPAQSIGHGANASMVDEQSTSTWLLSPATLPPMHIAAVKGMLCRHVEQTESIETETVPVNSGNSIPEEVTAWNNVLTKNATLDIPAHCIRRIIIDLGNYYCGYTQMRLSGGNGAFVRVGWAEGLYEQVLENAGGYTVANKGDRSAIDGKFFKGFADVFEPDGSANRTFRPLWWSAGRYLEIVISTSDTPLCIEAHGIEETHFPYTWKGSFASSEPRMEALLPMYKRTLEMCSHEIYMDCPHYEQLMYVADTRLEILQTYAMTADNALPRKAISLFDSSRRSNGLTQSRFPTRVTQVIPPFSLWWVGMVHDAMMYRSDPAFIADRMTGVRSVLDTFRSHINARDVMAAPVGWNFIDWVKAWNRGIPPNGERGLSAPISLQSALIFRLGAELEEFCGEPTLALRNRQSADRIVAGVNELFWDHKRGMFADDEEHTSFSEHAQCLGILGNTVTGTQREQVIAALLTSDDLHRATIYFSHYLFETFRAIGRVDLLCKRMDLWYSLKELGLCTTVETPEPSRSDCHGWGAHPMFHYFGSILGIRPAAPGFATVNIRPQLGTLSFAKGTMVHPKGLITVDVRKDGDVLCGSVALHDGISGLLDCNGTQRPFEGEINF